MTQDAALRAPSTGRARPAARCGAQSQSIDAIASIITQRKRRQQKPQERPVVEHDVRQVARRRSPGRAPGTASSGHQAAETAPPAPAARLAVCDAGEPCEVSGGVRRHAVEAEQRVQRAVAGVERRSVERASESARQRWQPGAAQAANVAAARIRSRQRRSGRSRRNDVSGIASGARFGRMRIAAAAASSAERGSAAGVPVTNATATSTMRPPARRSSAGRAGTERSGCTPRRAPTPAPIRAAEHATPTTNVAPTSSAPKSGTTRNAAPTPPAATNGAIAIERPDGQIGTIAPGTVGDGRCPAGAKVSGASGHGASSASGSGTCSVPEAQRCGLVQVAVGIRAAGDEACPTWRPGSDDRGQQQGDDDRPCHRTAARARAPAARARRRASRSSSPARATAARTARAARGSGARGAAGAP